MKAKIDLEKFICSMLNDSKTNAGYVHTKSIERALQDQGLEYKDGKIVEIDTIDTSSPRWAEIVKECKHDALEQAKNFNKERLFEVAKQETPEEKAEAEERKKTRKWLNFENTHEDISVGKPPLEEDLVGMGGLGKMWNEQAIISRLDRIIELLNQRLPNAQYPFPYPCEQPVIYGDPIKPDPIKGWEVTASTDDEGMARRNCFNCAHLDEKGCVKHSLSMFTINCNSLPCHDWEKKEATE